MGWARMKSDFFDRSQVRLESSQIDSQTKATHLSPAPHSTGGPAAGLASFPCINRLPIKNAGIAQGLTNLPTGDWDPILKCPRTPHS